MHGSMQNVAPVINQADRGGMLGYGGLAIVATLLTVLGARNPHTGTTGNSTRDSSNVTGSPIHGTAS